MKTNYVQVTYSAPESARKSVKIVFKMSIWDLSEARLSKGGVLSEQSPGLSKRSPGLSKLSPGMFKPSPGLFKLSPGLCKQSPMKFKTFKL